MLSDWTSLLLGVSTTALFGSALAVYLSRRSLRPRERDPAGSFSRSLWFLACGAAFSVGMATVQVRRGWWWFAAVFGAFAVVNVVAMGVSLVRRRPTADVPPADAPSEAMPPPAVRVRVPAIRVVFLNVVILGLLFGLFVWENLQPERLIVISASRNHYQTIQRGPGWPFPAYKFYCQTYNSDGVSPEDLLRDPFEESNRRAAAEVCVSNGLIGGVLVAALALNIGWARRLMRGRRSPSRASGSSACGGSSFAAESPA